VPLWLAMSPRRMPPGDSPLQLHIDPVASAPRPVLLIDADPAIFESVQHALDLVSPRRPILVVPKIEDVRSYLEAARRQQRQPVAIVVRPMAPGEIAALREMVSLADPSLHDIAIFVIAGEGAAAGSSASAVPAALPRWFLSVGVTAQAR
jgi:hypothetical protein